MAKVTNLTLRHQLIYQVYLRNYSPEASFKALEADLDRLKDLGVDLILLSSIFPSQQETEGEGDSLFVQSFDEIGTEYGSMADFEDLVQAVRHKGMKLLLTMEIVALAMDAPLVQERPDFFLQGLDGNLYSRLPEAAPVYDLNFSNPKMWDALIERMKYWAHYVDGFYIPHAQLIRSEFFSSARAEVGDVHPYFYWLGGQMSVSELLDLRLQNIDFETEGEMYSNFDVLDIRPHAGLLERYYDGLMDLANVAFLLNMRTLVTASTSVLNRGLELEAGQRIAAKVKNYCELRNWTAFSFFRKGIAQLMMGQEYGTKERIPIHEKKAITWDKPYDLTAMIRQLMQLKKREVFKSGYCFHQAASDDWLLVSYHFYNQHVFGLFKLRGDTNDEIEVELGIPEGKYANLLGEGHYEAKEGRIHVTEGPIIISYDGDIRVPR
ncbi:alpha-amylase family glycosyl hydrolase [Aerococcus sanguinicola]|uniref:alpha-amylase family glycosyl hydrolase n=1 Tax=unclassified Aerococcus TaxID=2618060 RepID=UPI0008A560AD|nr:MULTISPECIES: alpha-amylase family glycosyl hydrolase [unclassified Aerococcus]KAB0646636.1 alpha-amylase [Aerococcus sanguinicola]MDK6233942.1 alpha-amylase family glycosyl hydrolase [Aerococcus sp. UMB10185]MDK6856341.1 alpha-amylase family glycosyl hydrolase [Aerococcus sp. UMB7533]MDK8502688.1 alpha-amylase family glycosyl hydrolase [Aerococcus sp. UMB1112A]OFN05540.1 hypothetical protein HMPREF2626_03095 [Aerococcus sp. HMSC062A02]